MRKYLKTLGLTILLPVIVLNTLSCADSGELVEQYQFDYMVSFDDLPLGEYYVYEDNFVIEKGVMRLETYYRVAHGNVVKITREVTTGNFTLMSINYKLDWRR